MNEPLFQQTTCPNNCRAALTVFLEAQCDAPLPDGPKMFQIMRCPECSIIMLNPRPSGEHLIKYYDRDYYGPNNKKFDSATEGAVAFFVRWRAWILDGLIPGSSRVLDVGCGRGNFLEAMEKRGHEVFGTELSALSAEKAVSIFGEKIFIGDLLDLDAPPESFDMVSMWHVIEHVADPIRYIEKSFALLKPGGALVLAQPNIDSIQAKIGGPVWFHLDVPRHLYHFSPETLGNMMKKAGFTIVRVRQHSVEQNPFGLLQSILNRLGFRQNLLYKVIKKEPGVQIGKYARLGLLAFYYCTMPVAVILTEIGALLGMGGTFYIVGRKSHQ